MTKKKCTVRATNFLMLLGQTRMQVKKAAAGFLEGSESPELFIPSMPLLPHALSDRGSWVRIITESQYWNKPCRQKLW